MPTPTSVPTTAPTATPTTAPTIAPTPTPIPSNTLYNETILHLIDTKKLGDGIGAQILGLLYDIDGNGVDELIVAYPKNRTIFTMDVYTIYNGQVLPLLLNQENGLIAGAGRSEIVIVSKNNKDYLGFRYKNYNYMSPFGTWLIYDVTDNSAILDVKIDYQQCVEEIVDEKGVTIDSELNYEKSEATRNDSPWSYYEFEEWENSLDYKVIIPSLFQVKYLKR